MIVALDLDGCLFNLVDSCRRHLVSRGYPNPPLLPSTYNLTSLCPDRPDLGTSLLRQLHHGDFFATMEPFPEAVEAINRLAKHFTLAAVTSRHASVRPATSYSLAKHFPQIQSLYHAKDKVKVAKTIRPAFFIEDHAETALKLAQAKKQVILVTRYPFTIPPSHRRIATAHDMTAAVDMILSRIAIPDAELTTQPPTEVLDATPV